MFEIYVNAQKHARFLVFSPFSAYFYITKASEFEYGYRARLALDLVSRLGRACVAEWVGYKYLFYD